MNGLQTLASAALNLFREFVPGDPDAARFWLQMGGGVLAFWIILGILLRFFGSENVRPGLLFLSGTLGLALLAAGPAAVEVYSLPSIPPSLLSIVETTAQWTANRAHVSPWPARSVLLAGGMVFSLLLLVVPLTRLTFRIPGFLALIAWLAALATAGTASAVIRIHLPSTSRLQVPAEIKPSKPS
ncbi:MAG: hypothetical protein EBV83_05175 [Verrucomicrobia bacterium]|nr:hypothetical protein [Verrucomicrobiota bacterium]